MVVQPNQYSHPQEFQEFIHAKVEQRKQNFIKNQNFSIRVKPEFVNIFRRSQAVLQLKEDHTF